MMKFLYEAQINLMTIIVAIGFGLLFILLYIGARRETINCFDLITNREGKLDISAIGQLFGVGIAVWAPAYTVVQGRLDETIFIISLTYLAGIKGFSSYIRYKEDIAKGTQRAVDTQIANEDRNKQ